MTRTARKAWFGALLAALIGFEIAQSQEPPPSAGEPRQPEQAQPQPAQQGATGNQQGTTPPPPVIVNVHPAPKTEAEAAEERRERQEKSGLDRRLVELTGELAYFTAGLVAATVALFIATVGLAFFAWRQSQDMKASIAVAQTSADAAKKSAEAAEATISQMEKAATQQLLVVRKEAGAWIFASPWWPDLGEAGRESLRMLVSNHGRTPGLIVRYHMEFRRDEPVDDNLDYAPDVRKPPQTMGVGEGEKSWMLEHEFAWNGSDMFAIGFVEYEDAFGGTNTTRFCTNLRTRRPAGSRAYNTLGPEES